MNLQQFLIILRARYKVVLFTLLGTVAVALVLSVLLSKQYTATASVVVDVKSPDPIAGAILPALLMPGYMATQVDIINSDRVALKVVKLLKLDENPVVKEQWMKAEGKGRLETWLTSISDSMAQKIIKLLNLDESLAVKGQLQNATEGKGRLEVWLVELLQKKLTVKPSRESNVIEISYKAVDPGFAAAVVSCGW